MRIALECNWGPLIFNGLFNLTERTLWNYMPVFVPNPQKLDLIEEL